MAIGDGQMMDRVRSFLLEPTFANVEGMNPDDVARRRALAEALWSQGNSQEPVTSVFGGINRVLQSFLGGRGMRQAESADQFLRGQAEEQEIAGLNQMNDFAYPSQPAAPSRQDAPSQTYNAGQPTEWSTGDWPGGTGTQQVPASQQEFIDMMMPFAIRESERTGIDPRIIIAQAAQETGWGAHAPNNNYFGIKSHGEPGGGTFSTTEYVNGQPVTIEDSFRGYGSMDESARGYGDFMLENGRYEPMRTAVGLDAQLAALGASGYATDPNYATSVGSIARGINIPTANPVGEFVQTLISNPATRGLAGQIITQQINTLLTPPAPPEPYTLGANETRFDGNNQPVAQGQPSGTTPTDDMREYDLYRSQLRPGETPLSFTDWDIQRRRAGAPNYYENTWDRLTAEQQVALSNDIIGAEQTALNQIQNFDAMEALAADPNFYSGTGANFVTNVRRLGIALGISDPDIAAKTEAFSGLAAQAALDAMGGSLGAGFSNADREFIERTMPNLQFTPEGNRTLIAIHRAIAQRNIEIAEMLRQAGGRPTPEFMRTLTQWALANPLFANGIPGVGQAAPVAPAAPPTGTTTQTGVGAGQTIYQGAGGITIQRVP